MSLFRPRKISILTSLVLAFATTTIVALVHSDRGVSLLLSFLLLWVLSFLIINLALDRYVYQSIRSIYKYILQLRGGVTAIVPNNIPDHKMISEINRILMDWEKEKKEEINQLKEMEVFRKEFLGNVSHELKTPIFTIQGYLHTLIDGGIDDQDINLLYLTKAAKSLDRLASIVDDLEAISRLEGGDLLMDPRTFEIQELVLDVIESLELKAREKYIKILLADGDKTRQYVHADKDLIRQVLVNLLVNSIKYGKEHGITRISLTDHDDFITCEIADDGIGIEKHHLPRLFERFYRVDKSRSRDQGGTGLGLAIVKHIIEAHGEKISVDSNPGLGTTFAFTLRKSK